MSGTEASLSLRFFWLNPFHLNRHTTTGPCTFISPSLLRWCRVPRPHSLPSPDSEESLSASAGCHRSKRWHVLAGAPASSPSQTRRERKLIFLIQRSCQRSSAVPPGFSGGRRLPSPAQRAGCCPELLWVVPGQAAEGQFTSCCHSSHRGLLLPICSQLLWWHQSMGVSPSLMTEATPALPWQLVNLRCHLRCSPAIQAALRQGQLRLINTLPYSFSTPSLVRTAPGVSGSPVLHTAACDPSFLRLNTRSQEVLTYTLLLRLPGVRCLGSSWVDALQGGPCFSVIQSARINRSPPAPLLISNLLHVFQLMI